MRFHNASRIPVNIVPAATLARMKSEEGEEWLNLFMDMTGGAVVGAKVVASNIRVSEMKS